jgi:hypothetical protein
MNRFQSIPKPQVAALERYLFSPIITATKNQIAKSKEIKSIVLFLFYFMKFRSLEPVRTGPGQQKVHLVG